MKAEQEAVQRQQAAQKAAAGEKVRIVRPSR
jgi:hypothetical protein